MLHTALRPLNFMIDIVNCLMYQLYSVQLVSLVYTTRHKEKLLSNGPYSVSTLAFYLQTKKQPGLKQCIFRCNQTEINVHTTFSKVKK